jgi:hypothetical protein
MTRRRIPERLEPWIEARKRHRLSDAHVQMARELGMNPKKLGKLDNAAQEPWKLPLPAFIEKLYRERFGRDRPDGVVSMEERAERDVRRREMLRAPKHLRREIGEPEIARPAGANEPVEGVGGSSAPTVLAFANELDDREEVRELFGALRASVPRLEKLLEEVSSHWGYEDPIYRFYHQSWKVYWLQKSTLEIVAALQALAPDRPLNSWFRTIVECGTGKTFTPEDNKRWLEVTRPIVEAFFHARYFLEMAVGYGKTLDGPPRLLPSGWAALLYLYELR